MILREDVLQIGRLLKPYGIRGEITLLFDREEYADIDTDYYFLEIDGMFVPFFVEEMRFHTDATARVKFEGITNEDAAGRYAGLLVFLPREVVPDSTGAAALHWDQFLGYAVHDHVLGYIGRIESVDASTLNVLFRVTHGEEEYLIPATEDFITGVDESGKTVRMELP